MLLLLPMAVDGVTHMISDWTAGIGYGFRYHNAWLAGRIKIKFQEAGQDL